MSRVEDYLSQDQLESIRNDEVDEETKNDWLTEAEETRLENDLMDEDPYSLDEQEQMGSSEYFNDND